MATPIRNRGQAGIGMVEVLVASALLGVAITVMLASISSLLVGARTADRRTAEERLVRNQIEQLMAASVPTCSPAQPPPQTIDPTSAFHSTYTIRVDADCTTDPHYVEYLVTATDSSRARTRLSAGRVRP